MMPVPEDSERKWLGPSVVAAVVWLSLSLYMFLIVPIQLDLQTQVSKPEQMRAEMPAAMKSILRFHESRGTAILAALGVVGCGLAYMRRSSKLANVMVLSGTVCLIVLIWAVMVSLPKN